MGSCNMSDRYLTEYSYQIMPEEVEDDIDHDWLQTVIEEAEKSIENEIDEINGLSFMVSRTIEIHISLVEIEKENGYHSGVAFRPDFSVEFEYHEDKKPKWKKLIEEEDGIYEETQYLADSIDQMVIDNNYTIYSRVLVKYLKEFLCEDISKKLIKKAENKIAKYFNEVDKIMIKYTTPYTTGWCASPVIVKGK